MKEIESGAFGHIFISDYVFDETITLLRSRLNEKKAIEVGEAIFNSEIEIIFMFKELFESAWQLFIKRNKLSFTDCSIVETMKSNGIKYLASFDKEFNQFKKEIMIVN